MGNYHGGVLLWTCFILCYIIYTVHGQCPASQFACKNGNCIQMTWRCDEDDDCGDNSDEDNCGPKTCPGNNFQCANGKCIPERWHCDRDKDCQDGSDETPQDCEVKQCNDNEFTCGDKACIPSQWRCDLQKDCQDGSDEEKCERKCPDNEFGCKNGKCISNHWTCDQEDDCGDRSDEENCPNVNCSAGEVMCGDRKRCILERWLCDGDNDCRDKSDETNCTSTRKSLCDDSEFMCKNVPGECISLGWHCDGDQDCSDGSDEPADCKVTCKPTDFFCRISKYCIKGIYECNGRKDCLDGSDEDHCMNTSRSCGPEEFDCNGEGVFCIAKEKVCDGINDCGEFEDELVDPVRCRKSDPCETANCAHRCVNMHKTAKCQCHHGFKLGADNRSCEDIDECEINGICSQICINKKGHYTCACMDGYALENHRFCKAKVRPSLIFTNKKDVRKIMIGRRTYLTLVTNTSSAVALDYNYNTNHLYWSDVALEKIQRASIDGTGVESVVEEDIRTPDGLAIDWIHNLLYWTDTGKDTIEVMDLNTRHRRILFSENITEPRAIVLDPIEGWMYWTDWGTTPKIERSGMNGGQRSEIVSSPYDLEWPNGLALDHVGRRLYWNDAKLHLIASIKLDGSDMRIVKTDPALIRHPFALTVFEDSVYWTDWASESIQAVNKFTGENEVIALELKSPMDIHIYHPYGQPAGKNRCGSNNGGCAHLCLPAPHISSQSAHYTCVCRDGFVENKNDSTQCVAVVYTPSPNTTTDYNQSFDNVSSSNSSSVDTEGTIQGPSSKKPSQNTSANSTPKPTGQWLTVDLSNTATSGHGYTIQPQDNATDSNENQAINKTAEDKEGGSIALIAICICVALAVLLAVAGIFVYKRFIVQNKKTMNFDNPVYRKTTEEQFIIEKGGSSASIPSTMQPLTTENEYA